MSLPRYPRYKESGVEWLGAVPEHWEVKQLRHFAQVLRGKFTHRPRNDPAFYDGPFPFIQTGDITGSSRLITCFSQTLNERGIAVSKEFPKGTLVMAIAANIGDVAILDFPAYFPDSIVGLVPKTSVRLPFLYHLMTAMKQPMVMTATVSTQQNLNTDQICALEAVCPPEPEQERIATFLDHETIKIDSLIAEQQRLIELLKEKRQAVISHAVTKGLNPNVRMKDSGIEWLGEVPEHWSVQRIKNLSTVISKGTTPTTVGLQFTSEGVRFFKAENITEAGVMVNPEFFISESTHALLLRSALEPEDVLVVIAGATTGRAAVLDASLLPANTNQAVSFVRLHERSFAPFLAFWMTTQAVKELILISSVQSAQPNLSMEDLGNVPVPIPPQNERMNVIRHLSAESERLDKLTVEGERAIDLLQERRTALISAAVTGQIDVRGFQPAQAA